jgi:hypothetical protein
MSSDAKVWQDGDGWISWKGVHDGACISECYIHEQGMSLSSVLEQIEKVFGQTLRWSIRIYPDGKTGLVGYCV